MAAMSSWEIWLVLALIWGQMAAVLFYAPQQASISALMAILVTLVITGMIINEMPSNNADEKQKDASKEDASPPHEADRSEKAAIHAPDVRDPPEQK
jgi:hypothetical protein